MSVRNRKPSSSGTISETVEKVERSVKNALTINFQELPPWMQDNEYILTGHRPASGSFKKSFASLGYIHNETVNIYSHLLGAVAFSIVGWILYSVISPRYESATSSDLIALGCFFAGAALCLGMSATYHAIHNHSPIVAKFGNKLDYVGIVFLITGSFIPTIFYGFYCHPHLRETYWFMICSLGLGCATVSIFERFRTPAWRPYRAGMFVAMGLSALFPIVHGVKLYGVEKMRESIGLTWLVLQGVLYILGAGLYAARWPECASPGKYDIWGSSHQLFHILVIMAAASHLYGLIIAFDYHHGGLIAGGIKC